jgi:hypothetical protein
MHVSPRDYELDHIVPLDLGGASLDLRNLMLQPWAGACYAHMKDDLERRLSIMVCAGDLTLKGAQHEITTDWRASGIGAIIHSTSLLMFVPNKT